MDRAPLWLEWCVPLAPCCICCHCTCVLRCLLLPHSAVELRTLPMPHADIIVDKLNKSSAETYMARLVGLGAENGDKIRGEDKVNFMNWRKMLTNANRNAKRDSTDIGIFAPTALWLVAVRTYHPVTLTLMHDA